jgi:hypothetical protein
MTRATNAAAKAVRGITSTIAAPLATVHAPKEGRVYRLEQLRERSACA